jgi:acyl-CoA thioester hydrolase
MSRVFLHHATVRPEWIDYNGHMQDAYYGLVFSHAVDALQDAVGVDADYRAATGNTIYLLEDHKMFLREVKAGAEVAVATRVIGLTAKRFHLWAEMTSGGVRVAVSEMMELHVCQHPQPHGTPLPSEIHARLQAALCPPEEVAGLSPRARAMGDPAG